MKAKDLGVPTYDASVSCGAFCLGGSVNMQPTTYPEFTDVDEVWVRGEDAAALAARLAEAKRLLNEASLDVSTCFHNAIESRDQLMCDHYADFIARIDKFLAPETVSEGER